MDALNLDAPDSEDIAASIGARLADVRSRIDAACERAGRDPASVELIAVSKGHPASAIRAALDAGHTAFGENRVQELVEKARALDASTGGTAPAWHLIGHLQRNKVREALPRIAALHSVDSERLIHEIGRRAEAAGLDAEHPLPCYLEVNVAGETQKTGVAIEALPDLLTAAASCSALRVEGLMTVAPYTPEPETVRPVFRSLRRLADGHGLAGLSMGMTDDFEVAIEEGATVIRVGRAIFGAR